MNKHLRISLFCLLLQLSLFAQKNIESINGFKYAYVGTLEYDNNASDIYGVSSYLKSELSKKGFIILDNNSNSWPIEAKQNKCLIGQWLPSHAPGSIPNSARGGFSVKNCKNEVVYDNYAIASHFGYFYDKNVPLSIEKAFKPIQSFEYSFNEKVSPKFDYPSVEITTENEESIKKYLNNTKLDPIEGIYKSYQNDQMGYYKFGVIKIGGTYKAIVLESDLPQWKPGEVKASFEQSSMKGIYSAKWFMANKSSVETFSFIENNAILSIEFTNPVNNEKRQDKFVKMYPSINVENSIKADVEKASGSGFFISTNGIIATNSHVIEGANKIEITVTNELGPNTYNAKIVLNDSKNDVALIQIDDPKFKNLSSIPYTFTEKAEIGEKVFTIGYPLNDVMGSNFKVTDGIISSESGIGDDVRFYQISVPIQPGNSGGPLFNSKGNIVGITTAKLNSKAVGTTVENVNYSIKISYLLNLYNMMPHSSVTPTTTNLSGKELKEQVKILKNYVCLIKIF